MQLYNELDLRRRHRPYFLGRNLRYRMARRGDAPKLGPGARVKVAFSIRPKKMDVGALVTPPLADEDVGDGLEAPSGSRSAVVAIVSPSNYPHPRSYDLLGAQLVSLDVTGAEDTKKFQAEASFEVPESALLACQQRRESKRHSESGRGEGEADVSPPSTPDPKLRLLMMIWKDHKSLGVLHGQTKARRLDSGTGKASQKLVFGLLPNGAEVYWQSYDIRELDPLGQGHHSSARGTMRKGVVRNVPGTVPRLQVEEQDPGVIWGMEYPECSDPSVGKEMVSSDKQRRLVKATRDVPFSLHLNVSGTLNALVAIPRPRLASQIQYHYHFANNTMKKLEIATKYSCPFCVQTHPSFEALKCHLLLCHDLFHYAFHGRGGIGSAVNVACDPLVHDVEGRLILPEAEVYRVNHINKEFFFYRPPKKKGKWPSPVTVKDVERYHYEVAFVRRAEPMPEKNKLKRRLIRFMDTDEMEQRKRQMQRVQGSRAATQPRLGRAYSPPASKPAEEPKKPARAMRRSGALQKQGQPSQVAHESGQVFFHYRSYQPMKEAEAQGYHDSDLEDNLFMTAANDEYLLAEFEDVTQVEKKFMHKWNIFVHEHRIISDSMTFHRMKQFVDHMKDTLAEDVGFRRCLSMHLINFWDRGIFSSREVKLVLQKVDVLGQQVAAQSSQ